MSDADDLHEMLFGFRPGNVGVAYERLGALVMAALGWDDVVHDAHEGSPHRRAQHQLDVTARHPDGESRSVIVECKDWNTRVGKQTLDTLVGVRDQLDADLAAVMTTIGFTRGARQVASDEDIAMVVLRTDEIEGQPGFVKRVEITLEMYLPRWRTCRWNPPLTMLHPAEPSSA